MFMMRGMDARHYDPQKITKLRESVGMSQDALAQEVGVCRVTINRAEQGRSASYNLLVKIANALNVSVTEFLYPHPKPESEATALSVR
jgi:transcriptional regulator with XRE-family HTH domain